MVSVFILALNFGVGFVAHHTSSTITHPFWLSKQDTLLQGAKSIESRDYVEDIREGNRVVARRTLKLKYEVTWNLSDSGIRSNDVIEIYCWNECKGEKANSIIESAALWSNSLAVQKKAEGMTPK